MNELLIIASSSPDIYGVFRHPISGIRTKPWQSLLIVTIIRTTMAHSTTRTTAYVQRYSYLLCYLESTHIIYEFAGARKVSANFLSLSLQTTFLLHMLSFPSV